MYIHIMKKKAANIPGRDSQKKSRKKNKNGKKLAASAVIKNMWNQKKNAPNNSNIRG